MMARKFLVTGATKGIGLAISRRVANDGHIVIGVAREAPSDFPGTLVSIDLSDERDSAEAILDLASRHSFEGVSPWITPSVHPDILRWLLKRFWISNDPG